MELQFKNYLVNILTANYQISGEMSPRGDVLTFVNDSQNSVLEVNNAVLTPLNREATTGDITVKRLYVPKEKAQILIFGDYGVADARPLPTILRLSCLTDTYIINGNFHMTPEVTAADFLTELRGPYFPVSDVRIFNMRGLRVAVEGDSELMLLNGTLVESYFPDQ